MNYKLIKLFLVFPLLFIVLNVLYYFYSVTSIDPRINRELGFYLCILLASLGICYGLVVLRKLQYRAYFFNYTVFFWCLAFYVNSFKLLSLQILIPTSISFMILVCPILATIPTLLFTKRKNIVPLLHNLGLLKAIMVVSSIIAWVILIGEFVVSGIFPLLSDNINEARVSFGFPFFHVFSEGFSRLSLILALYFIFLKKAYRKVSIAIFVLGFIYFLFTFSRSALIELGLFIIILFSVINAKGLLDLSLKKYLAIGSLLVAFSALGSLRQEEDFDIQEYSGSAINSKVINWFYSYYFVNMDNLGLSIMEDKPAMKGNGSILFLRSLTGTVDHEKLDAYTYIGKLNLGSGFRDFTLDWGVAYGTLVMMAVLALYAAGLTFFRSDLVIIYVALNITYIVLLPMVNRFSSFIPFFVAVALILIDKILFYKYGLNSEAQELNRKLKSQNESL